MRIFRMKPISALCAGLMVSSLALAQSPNRRGDQIFNEPADGGTTEIIAGLGKLLASYFVFPGPKANQSELAVAQNRLYAAMDAPTSEAQRQSTIDAIQNDSRSYTSGVAHQGDLTESARYRIDEVRSAKVVTLAEKQTGIERAMVDLNDERAWAIRTAMGRGMLPKVIRGVRNVLGALILQDVGQQLYIWNVLDANPKAFPTVRELQYATKGR